MANAGPFHHGGSQDFRRDPKPDRSEDLAALSMNSSIFPKRLLIIAVAQWQELAIVLERLHARHDDGGKLGARDAHLAPIKFPGVATDARERESLRALSESCRGKLVKLRDIAIQPIIGSVMREAYCQELSTAIDVLRKSIERLGGKGKDGDQVIKALLSSHEKYSADFQEFSENLLLLRYALVLAGRDRALARDALFGPFLILEDVVPMLPRAFSSLLDSDVLILLAAIDLESAGKYWRTFRNEELLAALDCPKQSARFKRFTDDYGLLDRPTDT